MKSYKCPICGWPNFRFVVINRYQCRKCSAVLMIPEGEDVKEFWEYEGMDRFCPQIVVEEK